MGYGSCKTCLWWWDLYNTGERKCYRRESKFYHEDVKTGCDKHEESVHARMTKDAERTKIRKARKRGKTLEG